MLALNNKIAVITGGSSGIGLAIAKRFVSEGAYIFIASRRQSELDKAVAEIGKNVTAVQDEYRRGDAGRWKGDQGDARLNSELFGGCLSRSKWIRHREGTSV